MRGADDGYNVRGHRKALVSAVSHSRMAAVHLNVKPDLGAVRLKYFHRPRLSKAMRARNWRISLRGQKKLPLGSLGRRKSVTDFDRTDLSAQTGEFILIEYVEEQPPYVLNFGMASAMYNYYRETAVGDLEEETERKRRHRISDHSGYGERARVPRHVTLLNEHRDRKQAYDHDANIPRLPMGETKVLNPGDASPFIGDLLEGELQPSIANNLFRAPIFAHKPPATDFLLILIKGPLKHDAIWALREIPAVFLCGQTEPHLSEAGMCVPRPLKAAGHQTHVSRVLRTQDAMLALAIARFFHPDNFSSMDTGIEFHQAWPSQTPSSYLFLPPSRIFLAASTRLVNCISPLTPPYPYPYPYPSRSDPTSCPTTPATTSGRRSESCFGTNSRYVLT